MNTAINAIKLLNFNIHRITVDRNKNFRHGKLLHILEFYMKDINLFRSMKAVYNSFSRISTILSITSCFFDFLL